MTERYEDSTRAIEASRWSSCLSRNIFEVRDKNGKVYRARVARRAGRDYSYVYASMPTMEIKGVYPSSSDIDRVREWEAF